LLLKRKGGGEGGGPLLRDVNPVLLVGLDLVVELVRDLLPVLMLLRSTSFVGASLTSRWTLGFIRTYLKWYLATVPPYVVFFATSFLALLP
jgi:hypothetical protein